MTVVAPTGSSAKASSPKLGPTGTYSFTQLETIWVQGGGNPGLAPTMAAIALAESGGRPNALHNSAYPNLPNYKPPAPGGLPEYSVGLWQLNYVINGQWDSGREARWGTPANVTNPLANASGAASLAKDGSGLTNWSTYNNHSYLGYLPRNASSFGGAASWVWNKAKGIVEYNPPGMPGPAQAIVNPGSVATGTAGAAGTAAQNEFNKLGLTANWKDIYYGLAVFGGGVMILVGIVIVAADLGVAVAQKAKKNTIVVNVQNQRAKRNGPGTSATKSNPNPGKHSASEKKRLRVSASDRAAAKKARAKELDDKYGKIPY